KHQLTLNYAQKIEESEAYDEASDSLLMAKPNTYYLGNPTKLQIKYPDVNFYLIIGSDMLRIFDKWYRYQDILKIATVLSGAREQNELHELEQFAKTLDKTGQKIKVVIHDVLPMSSTMVRKAIKNNSDATQFLLPQIYEYIKQNKLYE
ncbi:MAG: hypothetical protein IKV58_02240, partial [Oscillospiraceae bacterium]|nr:hypothetical protein [Oscillospiraceae bacterium]